MGAKQILKQLDISNENQRSLQLQYLCHFLDVFASGDPVMRAGAAQYGETLRADGCDGDEVIRIAATALLVAIEHEIDQRALVLNRLPAAWRGVSANEQ